MEKVDLICEKEKQPQQLPGFRFHPTEEELVGFYLRRKVDKESFKFNLIRDLDLYDFEPWDLAGLAVKREEREWFFFVKPRGHSDGRPNRITDAGFWKATGTDKPVYTHSTSTLIGFRKTLVFYKGRALKAHKTDWIMNEYRLHLGGSENGGDVRLCRVYRKASSMRSFDRRPLIQVEKRVNRNNNFASRLRTSNSCKFSEDTSAHSFAEYKFGEECRMNMVKGAENLSRTKLEAEVDESEIGDLANLDFLDGYCCWDDGTYKCGEECGMSMVKGQENLCKQKIEAAICESKREDFTRFYSLEGWWCCVGATSNSMDTLCTNVILNDFPDR